MVYQVVGFQTVRGEDVVESFLKVQPVNTQARMVRLIDMLKYSPNLGMPYSKKLQKDLYELRISGSPAVRILYTFKGNVVYLLHAFKKKTQKTPRKEIDMALRRLALI